MSDWPGDAAQLARTVISTLGEASCVSTILNNSGASAGSLAWPAANRAIYVPVLIENPVTVLKMAVNVAVQSGNLDVGIYDEMGNRIVSKGSTAVGAAGLQTVDITDTTLNPGLYFIAMCVDNTTASFTRVPITTAEVLRMGGMQQQAVGAVTLPDPATFANPATGYVPLIGLTLVSVI